jgi:hypothetical protein
MFEIKSFVIGVIISTVVGGGIYVKYLKTGTKILTPQINAYALLGECTSLLNRSDVKSLESFLEKAKSSMPEIKKSDAGVAGVGVALGGDVNRSKGFGTALSMCIKNLNSELDILKEQADQS